MPTNIKTPPPDYRPPVVGSSGGGAGMRILLLIIALLVVAGIGAAAYFFLFNDSADTPDTEDTADIVSGGGSGEETDESADSESGDSNSNAEDLINAALEEESAAQDLEEDAANDPSLDEEEVLNILTNSGSSLNLNLSANRNQNTNMPLNRTMSTPDNTDSDGDKLSDADEIVYGTDPSVEDTDEDTYDDSTEIQRCYNPLGSGPMTLTDYTRYCQSELESTTDYFLSRLDLSYVTQACEIYEPYAEIIIPERNSGGSDYDIYQATQELDDDALCEEFTELTGLSSGSCSSMESLVRSFCDPVLRYR